MVVQTSRRPGDKVSADSGPSLTPPRTGTFGPEAARSPGARSSAARSPLRSGTAHVISLWDTALAPILDLYGSQPRWETSSGEARFASEWGFGQFEGKFV
jgi:hypothetical protein